ncbi:unnamed protein product [Fusarium venenatum]|uniref:Uncharacterized protein n=1 Tax=Fusarium venenatum TaxID=56646 RepID=A0A2L2TV61_9HYPO|nr:uncharacterized protein FVRRES_09734 [Fusarium venenatum]CEI69657.1 unnamed protein product [Fusarium venenatum]
MDFLTDSNITITRFPSGTISNLKHLTVTERYALRFHLRQWMKVVDKEEANASDEDLPESPKRKSDDEDGSPKKRKREGRTMLRKKG